MPEAIIHELRERYKHWFDLLEQPSFIDFPLDIYAHFHQENKKYFASKKVALWRMNHEDHCFVKHYAFLEQQDLDTMVAALKKGIGHLVKPSSDHMKTFLTGVLITANPLSPQLAEKIKKFAYCKAFMFYIHGWCDLRLIVVDLSSRQVITNKAGLEVKKFYQDLLDENNKKREGIK